MSKNYARWLVFAYCAAVGFILAWLIPYGTDTWLSHGYYPWRFILMGTGLSILYWAGLVLAHEHDRKKSGYYDNDLREE